MRKSKLIPLLALCGAVWAKDAAAAPTLDDYRHFRALTVDLLGRIPTRAEIATFEKPDFNLDAWVDTQLQGPGYADRLTRIYMDLLRLQESSVFNASNNLIDLRREKIKGPNGDLYVYYRLGQRRTNPETDGDFCLTPDQTGLAFPVNTAPVPYPTPNSPPKAVSQADLDAATVTVKPWWLYRDYKKGAAAKDIYNAAAPWPNGFQPIVDLLTEADGTPTTQIRICKEEAQATDTAPLYVSGRKKPVTEADGGLPYGRFTSVPYDDAFTQNPANAGAVMSCRTQTGISHAAGCGCGAGLEHCFPTDGNNVQFAAGVQAPDIDIFGAQAPIDSLKQAGGDWNRLWWSEEARQFFMYIFGQDRNFNEVLTGSYSFVNGPLVQYYRSEAPASCCGGAGLNLGYMGPEPLFDPSHLPSDLSPLDANKWEMVQTRGPHASGILSMPIFLTKFGTRRSRAHVLYNAFLCKDFIAPPNLQLMPSTDSNLMTRPGCNSCHATLEPLAAYFSRIMESDITYLPADKFPADTKSVCSGSGASSPVCQCKNDKTGNLNGTCKNYYDPAFSDTTHAVLRGAYPDVTGATQGHAESGPAGIAAELTSKPEFAACVAQNVATSFLGRTLTTEDAGLQQALTAAFVSGGFKMRAVVRAMLTSDVYRHSNNLTSSAWRNGSSL